MKKAILVTGTPGTGKTSIAKGIAEYYDYEYILISGHKDYVSEIVKGVKLIDVDKMIKWIKERQERSEKVIIIDSHLSHYYPKELTRMCFVTRCDPAELRMRLKKREYNNKKIRINLEAEAMDLILQEAIKEEHRIHEINTTHRSTKSSMQEAISVLEEKKKKSYGSVNFNYYLMKP